MLSAFNKALNIKISQASGVSYNNVPLNGK